MMDIRMLILLMFVEKLPLFQLEIIGKKSGFKSIR